MSNSVLFPIQVQVELPRTFFPTIVQRVSVRTNFVQEEPLGLRCLTKIGVIHVVEDVSIYLEGNSDF